ncbi:MAG: tripartite tricarboxylate transporter substrate binding protein [Betaproteobacteria bacterium]|nr:tripartite tricarboxylate transporter substrate binding protein [Betaproteobacteria bacterium]
MRNKLNFVFGVTVCVAAFSVAAQNYPVKPVRVVVPWPPGGANDIVGRVMAQRLSEQTGQQFIVDNRGGANGTIGADAVVKALADGYTLMVHSAAHITNPHLYRKLPYDTLKDFTGVTTLAVQVGMLVTHPSLPVKNVKEFVALARAQPGKVVYASSGSGSFVHLAMALINSMTQTQMVHVPYKGGGPAVVALASGETQAMTATIGSVMPHLASKRVRALGVTSATRLKPFPDVPAIAETIKDYEFVAWVGAFVSAGTPRPIVDRLNAEFKKALEHPDVVKILGGQTLDPMYMAPEQFALRLKADYDRYEKLVRLTGATAN